MSGRLRGLAIDTRPLRHRDYRRLFVGQGVSFVGFQVTAVAVPVQVYEITRSSFWVGILGLVGLLPLIVFGLWGGAVADAVDRRMLLLVSATLTWLVTLGLLVQALLGLDSVGLILGLVAVQSAAFAVASPTRNAILPRLLSRAEVPAANTLNFTVTNVGTVAGPLLAGVIIARWGGFAVAYATDAVLFTVALYAALRLPPLPPLTAASALTRPGLRSVIDGLQFIAGRPVLLMSFGVDIIAMVFAMPRALFPEVSAERFGGEGAVGWLFAAISMGAVLGGLSSGWIGRVRRQGVALTCAIVGWGTAVALAGLGRTLWVTVALLAVAGAADLVSSVLRQTILQVYAPDEMRGRLQGVFVVVVAGGPRLGDVRAGATAAVAGATFSWVAGGIASVALVLVAVALVPAFRHYDAAAHHGPETRDPEDPLVGVPELDPVTGEPIEGTLRPLAADEAALRNTAPSDH
ncbi:MAG TPA: MFS transporter [Mycobacteriales bacterium]|nr:MFS transporter [Mycobacteriales bacterium]